MARNHQTALVIAAAFGGFGGFGVLVPVVPLISEPIGGPFGAGVVLGAMMLGTVAMELVDPRVIRWLGYQRTFILGLLLLGAPSLGYGYATDSLVAIVLISLIRGAGFGVLTVIPPALIAGTTAEADRSSALGAYAFFMAVAMTVGPPTGLLLFDVNIQFAAIGGALLPLLAAVFLSFTNVSAPPVPLLVWRRLRLRAPKGLSDFLRPLFAWLPGSIVYGAFYSFIALWAESGVPVALAAFGCSFAMGRLIAGRAVGRVGPLYLLRVGCLTGAIGVGGLFVPGEVALAVGSALAGGGAGMMSLSALLGVLETVEGPSYPIATAGWAISFDAGLAIGGVFLGAVAYVWGYGAAFALGGVMLLAGAIVAGWGIGDRTAL